MSAIREHLIRLMGRVKGIPNSTIEVMITRFREDPPKAREEFKQMKKLAKGTDNAKAANK